MSLKGRPSARGAHKRNLIGPNEILKSIEARGGVPDNLMEELRQPRERNPRTEEASEAAVNALRGASEQLTSRGIEHEMGERPGPNDPDPKTAIAREMAWSMSVTNSMRESVPRSKWCRHMRAADPRLMEIRTMAVISAGVWKCVECIREAGPAVLKANPWPTECDLCGAEMQPGHFNTTAFNLLGCFVECTVCDECASFKQFGKAA